MFWAAKEELEVNMGKKGSESLVERFNGSRKKHWQSVSISGFKHFVKSFSMKTDLNDT